MDRAGARVCVAGGAAVRGDQDAGVLVACAGGGVTVAWAAGRALAVFCAGESSAEYLLSGGGLIGNWSKRRRHQSMRSWTC